MVVEDEPLVRLMAVEIVQDAGFAALAARNADEALELLAAEPSIGVVVTDIDMPGSMDGLGLIEVVRRRWPNIHLVVASGLSERHRNAIPADVGVFGKPYPVDELTRHLKNLAIPEG